jgi:hypothetical protein
MPSQNEIERLAAMANQLRPEWPVRSLVTLLTKHAARPYRDLAVTLAWIATDAQTKTPARLSEAGPWWTATSMTEGQGPTQSRMRCATHAGNHAGHCQICVDLAVPKPEGFVVPKRDRHLTVWQAGADGPWSSTSSPKVTL